MKLTVSASSFSTFFRCSQQYFWQFVEEKVPDDGGASPFTPFGSAFHKCMELHFKYGIPFEEIIPAWRSLLITFFSETKGLDFPSKDKFSFYFDKGLALISNSSLMKKRWEKQGYKILEVEKYFRIPFDNSYFPNVFLTGRIDLLLQNDSFLVPFDWKTSKNKEEDIDNNVQLTFYNFFVSKIYNKSLDEIFGALAYPIDEDIIFSQRENEDTEKLFEKTHFLLRKLSEKNFSKEPKHEMRLGDCFFCPYKKTCEAC